MATNFIPPEDKENTLSLTDIINIIVKKKLPKIDKKSYTKKGE